MYKKTIYLDSHRQMTFKYEYDVESFLVIYYFRRSYDCDILMVLIDVPNQYFFGHTESFNL